MKELVELLVKNIVDEPKAVKIKEERDSAGDKIILRVADEDMGKRNESCWTEKSKICEGN